MKQLYFELFGKLYGGDQIIKNITKDDKIFNKITARNSMD